MICPRGEASGVGGLEGGMAKGSSARHSLGGLIEGPPNPRLQGTPAPMSRESLGGPK